MDKTSAKECKAPPQMPMENGFEEIYQAMKEGQFGKAYESIVSLASNTYRQNPKEDKDDAVNRFFGGLELELNHDCNPANDIDVLRDGKGLVASVYATVPGKDVLGRPAAPVRAEIFDRDTVRRDVSDLHNSKSDKMMDFWTYNFTYGNTGDSILRERFRSRNPEYDSAIEDFNFRQTRQRNSR